MRSTILPLLLLCGCGQQEEGADKPAGAAARPVAEANVAAGGGVDAAAQMEERVKAAMAAALQKAERARYADLRPGATGSICGSVDPNPGAKGGGLRPFVVTPEGIAVISMTAQIGFNEPGDIFPDYYIRWCASPDELARLGPRVSAGGRAFAPGLGEDIPDLVPLDLPAVPPDAPAPAPSAAQPPPAAAPAPRAEAPPPPGEDSFSKAVIRKRDDTKEGQ